MKRFSLLFAAAFLASCGGGGSSPQPTSISVTPASATPTVAVTCPNPHNANYPDTYLGNHTIPVSTGKLESNVQRVMGLKDYYVGNLYPVNESCGKNSEYAKRMYEITLDRLKDTGVEYIWIYQYGEWKNLSDDVWTVNKLQIPEDVHTFIIEEAKKRNIKVYWTWQFHLTDINNNTVFVNGKIPVDTFKKIMATHRSTMLYWAQYNQDKGVSGMSVDAHTTYLGLPSNPELEAIYVKEMSTLIDDIRKIYKGKLIYGVSENLERYYQEIYSKVDMLHVNIFMPTKDTGDMHNQPVNLENLKKWITCSIEHKYQRLQEKIKLAVNECSNYVLGTKFSNEKPLPPIMLDISIQSRDKYLKEGWVEDGFCVSGTNTNGSTNTCVQETYTTDFSLQALVIEAALQAVKDQKFFNLAAVNFSTSYWLTDTLVASGTSEGFPNLSQSVRGKPAERVIKQWYSR